MNYKELITNKVAQIVFAALVNFSCLVSYANADQATISQAKELFYAGKAVEAYQLLIPLADELAGSVQYDYLLGQVAIDAGEPLQGIFALERVLDQKPDFAPARAELARAYFNIGENEAAKAEFKQVQQVEMPAGSQQLISSYISTIDERILGGITDSSFYVAAGLGYDSNVNSAGPTSQIALQTGTLTLTPEKESGVGILEVGGRYSHAIKQNIKIYGGVVLELYNALDERDFSTQIADGVAGLHFLQGRNQYRVSMVGQIFALDGIRNRNLFGISSQWQHTINAANQFTLFGQYAGLRFPGANRLDVNQLSIGATWLHAFASVYQPIAYFTTYFGDESEQTDIADSEYVGREYFGLRAGVRFKTSAQLSWSGVLTYQQSEYGGLHPLSVLDEAFSKIREDDYVDVTMGANYIIKNGWHLLPEITYSKNESKLEINSYDRVRAMVTVRKDF